MKKSEMAERIRKHFNTEHCDQVAFLAYQIIDFLEQQGMRPPLIKIWRDTRLWNPASQKYEDAEILCDSCEWEPEEDRQ